MTSRIALLIDGDNISAAFAHQIMQIAARAGRVDIARVYGNAQTTSGWSSSFGFRYIHAGAGKNAADLLLTVDAMELALTAGIEGFVLVSSDSDFSHLAQRLKEHGLSVAGIGEAKAPRAFRAACTSFHQLAPPASAKPTLVKSAAKSAVPTAQPGASDDQIRKIIAENSADAEGITITLLSSAMKARHGVQISKLPDKTWRRYFEARPHLYEVDPKGPDARVRLKRAAAPTALGLVNT